MALLLLTVFAGLALLAPSVPRTASIKGNVLDENGPLAMAEKFRYEHGAVLPRPRHAHVL